MSSKDSVSKISLSSFDDLFQTDESREDMRKERLNEIPIALIQDFPEHPYQVKDDESMDLLIDSIKSRGLIQPVLVRPVENGMYEMVSGHRRKRAFELIGIEKIPARVQELTRDESILSMVDSNLQREEILPSEKAFAYKMRLEAMKRQAGRPSKENASPLATNYSKGRSDVELGEIVGESKDQIRRFIRLTHLIQPILNLVDEKLIGMRPAVEISYLSEEQQGWLYDAIEFNDAWRCINRIENGVSSCDAIGAEEQKLHAAICRCLNKMFTQKDETIRMLKHNLLCVFDDNSNAEEAYAIENEILNLEKTTEEYMDMLNSTGGNKERIMAEIENNYSKVKHLRNRLETVRASSKISADTEREMQHFLDLFENTELTFNEFDDVVIRRLVECIRVMKDRKIIVILKGGTQAEDFI